MQANVNLLHTLYTQKVNKYHMNLNFYLPQPESKVVDKPKKSRNSQNVLFFQKRFSQNMRSKSQLSKENQQLKSVNQERGKQRVLRQEQKFFPSIRPRIIDPYKMYQLYTIKQKEKRQGIQTERKIKMYKQLLEKEQLLNQSKQRYFKDRSQRYDKIKNGSFICLKDRLDYENRFNRNANNGFHTMDQRSTSLYFRTLDQLEGTIHQINKKWTNHNTMDMNQGKINQQIDSNHKRKPQSHSKLSKYNYRYFQSLEEDHSVQNNVSSDIMGNYQQKRNLEILKERQRINQMVKMYRQYEESEALAKANKSNR